MLKLTLAVATTLSLIGGTALAQGTAPESQPGNTSQTEVARGNSTGHGVESAAGYHGGSDAMNRGAAQPTRKQGFSSEPESISRGTEP